MIKILVIDDDKVVRNILRIKFNKAGYDVQLAENGKLGLALMKSFHPDLVLLDLIMPVMDGFTTLTQAKGDPEIAAIPIIILTNLSQTEDIQKTLSLGAIDFIVKSDLSSTEILEKLKPYLKTQSN